MLTAPQTIHSNIAIKAGKAVILYYHLRFLDVNGCGAVLFQRKEVCEALEISKEQYSNYLNELVTLGLIKSVVRYTEDTKTSVLTHKDNKQLRKLNKHESKTYPLTKVFLLSLAKAAAKLETKAGVCFELPSGNYAQELKNITKHAILATHQVYQQVANYCAKHDKKEEGIWINTNKIVDIYQQYNVLNNTTNSDNSHTNHNFNLTGDLNVNTIPINDTANLPIIGRGSNLLSSNTNAGGSENNQVSNTTTPLSPEQLSFVRCLIKSTSAIGYNLAKSTLILVKGVRVGFASQDKIAEVLGVSVRTVGRVMAEVPKVRLAFWSSQNEKIGKVMKYAGDSEAKRFIKFKRSCISSNGVNRALYGDYQAKDMLVELSGNIVVDLQYIIFRKTWLKGKINRALAG